MLRSLVGSEMCIRDSSIPPAPSLSPLWGKGGVRARGDPPLVVNCHEFVRGHQATHGWSTVERAMAALPVVVVEPRGQRLRAMARARVGSTVGPLAQQGLDEALGLAIGARGVRARAQVPHTRAVTEAGEPGRDIAGAIVSQHAPVH